MQNVKEVLLDDFEHGDMSKYETNHTFVQSYRISLSTAQARHGTSSLQVAYDFGGWLSGNGAMFIKFKDSLRVSRMPRKLGVWVYTNGTIPWLRATILDGYGERKTVNLTAGNMSWHGWKYLDAGVDNNWQLPLRLEQIYAVEIEKAFQGDASCKGEFYIDQLRFIYQDDEDLAGPVFSDIYPERDFVYQDSFTFSAIVTDERSGVNPDSICMKVNNEKVDHFFCEKSNKISYSFKQVEQDNYTVTVEAKDFAGNPSVPSIDKVITVDLSPDVDKPLLSNVTPTSTALVYTRTPRITFNVIDEKSGIDSTAIHVSIDNEQQLVTYDEDTGWGYAVSTNELDDGVHHLTIMAKDRAGNQLGPIHQPFTITGLGQPTTDNDFKVSIIPDTHASTYGQIALHSAVHAQTDFIIHMGDMVDQATEEEYIDVQNNLTLLGDKPILTVPGNHESFQGNLDSYMKLFGSPTYHLTYGNALFIFLNTAYDQSIRLSDSTQMDYVERVLEENKQSHIVVVTHVPTKDRFGTSHDMRREDAKELEEILSTYKQKHPSTHMTVLFGHLHVIDHWQVAGVHYMITGNGASKGYVAHQQGNIVGHGVLHVAPSGITYHFMPYVEQVFIHGNDGPIKAIRLIKGTSHRLHVQVEVKKLSSNYLIDITDFDIIQKNWFSTNDSVVKVSDDGVVQAIDNGSATIVVEVSGKQAELEISIEYQSGD